MYFVIREIHFGKQTMTSLCISTDISILNQIDIKVALKVVIRLNTAVVLIVDLDLGLGLDLDPDLDLDLGLVHPSTGINMKSTKNVCRNLLHAAIHENDLNREVRKKVDMAILSVKNLIAMDYVKKIIMTVTQIIIILTTAG